jgi:hypothetical protein
MAFDYSSPAELFIPKRKGIGGARSPITYRRFATAAGRLSASPLRNFLPSEHSALGCRSEKGASIAMRFTCMRAVVIRFGVTCLVRTTELGERYDDQRRSKACRRSRTSVAKADKALDAGSAEHLLCGDVQTAAIQIQKRTTGRHSEMGRGLAV